jgi:tetratricopeptide (TPR) repeat protein
LSNKIIALAMLAAPAIWNLPLAALADEPWSADGISLSAPAPIQGKANFASSTAVAVAGAGKGASYQDPAVENALDSGNYGAAQSLIGGKINSANSVFGEAYLRTALVEALTWQGQLASAAAESKKLTRILDGLSDGDKNKNYGPDDIKELRARAADAQAWMLEAQGKLEEAQTSLGQAIALLKELHAVDRQTWRLVGAMSHSAGLKAEAGDYAGARQLLEEALNQVNGSHSISPLNVADTQESLGAVLSRLGDRQKAADQFGQALAIKNSTQALTQRYAPGPFWQSPVYKFYDGAPWCAKGFQNGVETKRMDLGAVSVECAVVRDKAAKQVLKVTLLVVNKSGQTVEFEGRPPTLIVLNPKATWAKLIPPTDLASKVEKKADSKAKWTRFWGQGATQTVTSSYMGNMPMYGYGYGGGYPYYNNRNNNNYAFSTMNIPDPIAEAHAFQKAQAIQEAGRAKADTIRSESLGPSDIAAGQNLNGSVYFEAGGLSKNSGCLVRIPIGNSQCEFRFENIPDAP